MVVRFREFEFDRSKRLLLRRGKPLNVGQIGIDLLALLIERRDRVVSHEELRQQIWSGRQVASSTIPTAINVLRKALGDRSSDPELVQTVYGHGYRWIAPISEVDRPSAEVAPGRRRGFVGRVAELAEAMALCEAAPSSGRIGLFVCGEAGIGKTRLLEECGAIGRRRGFRVAVGRCSEVSGAPALLPWRHVLEQLGVGQLQELIANPMCESPEDAGAARYELLERLAERIRESDPSRPALLIFDDLHRADVPTLLMLDGMLRSLRPAGIRVVGAFRTAAAHAEKLKALRSVSDVSAVSLVELSGFSAGEATELVRDLANFEVSDGVLKVLLERSNGNPLFLEQLTRQLNASVATDGDPTWAVQRTGESLTRLLSAEYAVLAEDAMRVLKAGAVVGRQFDTGMVCAISEMEEGEVLRILASKDVSDIVEEEASGHYRFRHVLHRDAIYQEIAPHGRVRMHEAALDELRRRHGELVCDVAVAAVPHLLALPMGDRANETVALLEAAADWSELNLGYEQAAGYLKNAVSVLERSSGASPSVRSGLLIRLGGAQRRSGAREESMRTFKAASELARAASDPELFAKAALGFAPGFFAIEAGVVDEQLIEMLEEALNIGREARPELRCRLLGRLGMALYWSEQASECERLGEEAVTLAQESGDPEALAFAVSAREVSRWGPEGAAERAQLAQWAINSVENTGNREMELVYRLYRLTSLLQLGEFDTAWLELDLYSRRAVSSLHGGALWYRDLLLALKSMMRGDWERSERLADDFTRLGRTVRDRNAENCAVIHSAYRQIEYGSESVARELIHRQAELYPRVRSYECGRAFLAAISGDEQEARRRLARLVGRGSLKLPRTVEWMIGAALLAEASYFLRDKTRARCLFDAMQPYEDEFVVVVYAVAVWRPVSYFLARLADITENYQESERLFEKAIGQARKADAAPWEAHSKFGFSEMLRRRAWPGDGVRARKLALEAQELAVQLGMRPLVARINSFLWGPGRSSGGSAVDPHPKHW